MSADGGQPQRLTQSRLMEVGIFEPGMIQRLLREYVAGSVDHNHRLWLLLHLEIWYELSYWDALTRACGQISRG